MAAVKDDGGPRAIQVGVDDLRRPEFVLSDPPAFVIGGIEGDNAHDAVDSGDPVKIGGKASTNAPTAVAVGDRVNAWFDLNGRLIVAFDSGSVPGTGATNLGKAEDAAHSSGDTGVMLLAVRQDTAAALAGTDADYLPLIVGSDGGLWVRQSQPLPAGEAHLGQIGREGALLEMTLVLDAGVAYADGDVLADTAAVASAFRVNDGTALLESLVLVDEDDQGIALDLLFFNANVSLGTINGAPGITDANARNFLGKVAVATGDYIDLGGVRVATKTALGLLLKAASGGKVLYVAAVTRGGTPTYTASGIKLRLGLTQN